MCPSRIDTVNYLANLSYDGVVYLMSFHVNGTSPDPMSIAQSPASFQQVFRDGVSCMYCRYAQQNGAFRELQHYAGVFNESLENYPAHCGVAIRSDWDEAASQAVVTVKVTSERTSEYRLILYIAEDGLKYRQNDGGVYRDYTHEHVVRKLLSATVDGDKLGQIAAGKEETEDYTVTLDDDWNAENLSFYALVTDENGYVNNLAVCKAVDGRSRL